MSDFNFNFKWSTFCYSTVTGFHLSLSSYIYLEHSTWQEVGFNGWCQCRGGGRLGACQSVSSKALWKNFSFSVISQLLLTGAGYPHTSVLRYVFVIVYNRYCLDQTSCTHNIIQWNLSIAVTQDHWEKWLLRALVHSPPHRPHVCRRVWWTLFITTMSMLRSVFDTHCIVVKKECWTGSSAKRAVCAGAVDLSAKAGWTVLWWNFGQDSSDMNKVDCYCEYLAGCSVHFLDFPLMNLSWYMYYCSSFCSLYYWNYWNYLCIMIHNVVSAKCKILLCFVFVTCRFLSCQMFYYVDLWFLLQVWKTYQEMCGGVRVAIHESWAGSAEHIVVL